MKPAGRRARNDSIPSAPSFVLNKASAAAFARWQDLIARTLLDAGVGRTGARRLATLVVSAIEGATLLCRARRDIRPLRDVHRALDATMRAAMSWHGRLVE